MENISAAIELLGENNVKRLQDGIVDILLHQIETDINERYHYDYIIDFDDIMEEVQKEARQEIKEKVKAMYVKRLDKVAEKLFTVMEDNQ